jgi:tetratricopeptide (TPR) repeat protein
MFELIREYALQRLHAAGEEEEYYRRRHAVYFAHLSESARYQIPTQRAQAASLLLDIPNIHAAIQWAEEKHEVALGLQLVRSFWGGWFSQVHISEAEEMLERMVEISWQSGHQDILFEPRANALYAFGQSLLRRGKSQRAEAVARETLERAQSIGDHCSISSALATMGQIAQMDRNLDEAETLLVESDEHARLGGFPDLRSITLRNLAELARMQGDLDRAIVLYEEAMDAARAQGMTFGVALIMTLLGHLARQQQNYSQAKARYREGLMILSAYDSPTYTAWCLEGYAAALCAEENYIQTTRLCAAASSLREEVQTPLPPAERQAFELTIATAKTALGALAFEKEWTIGTGFTQDQAIDYALSNACA